MDFKYAKLRGRIVEKYGTLSNFANEIGITKEALSLKMRGKSGITQKDILKWSKVLDIDKSEYADYFFS